MRVFDEILELDALEQAGRWSDGVCLLYERWLNDKNNVEKLCHVLFECWYALIEMTENSYSCNLTVSEYKMKLIEVTGFGMKFFMSNPLFLWVAGYAISLFPYYFYEEGDADLYSEWERIGKNMLLRADQIAPDDLIVKVFYAGTKCDSPDYHLAKQRVAPYLDDFFPSKMAVDRYLKEILMVK